MNIIGSTRIESFFSGLCAGIITGGLCFLGFLFWVLIPKTNAQADAFKKVSEDAAHSCDERVSSLTKTAVDLVAKNSAGFTVLLEPAPAQPSPLQVFDVLRPGLGTLLGKLQRQDASGTLVVKWVVPSHVRPLPSRNDSFYCWLDEAGNVDEKHCPALESAAAQTVTQPGSTP